MKHILIAATLSAPLAAFAAGLEQGTPPAQTNTTKTCTGGAVWDPATKACIKADSSFLNDDQRYDAARELAYAGRYPEALAVLAAMSDPMEDRVLTYKGFATRKMGNKAAGLAFYNQALERNPDNFLARSYLGQALVEQGNLGLARAQLSEIRQRGGRGTWAELSLRMTLENGRGYAY